MNYMKILNDQVRFVDKGDESRLPKGRKVCMYCRQSDNNHGKFGPLFQFNQMLLHYFCILFSTGLEQKGTDSEGIFGFLDKDIRLNLESQKAQECHYCNKTGATVLCANGNCSAAYHFVCGRKSGCSFAFFGQYLSRCSQHAPTPRCKPNRQMICEICHVGEEVQDAITTICCKKEMHRFCIQKHAFERGYFFQCPTNSCRDTTEKGFRNQMKRVGIFIPKCDVEHIVEEEDQEMEDLVTLPLPLKVCCIERELKMDNYMELNHGHDSTREITISESSPLPQVCAKICPSNAYSWTTLDRGGSFFISFSSLLRGQRVHGRVLRLGPNEKKRTSLNDPQKSCELILVSYDKDLIFGFEGGRVKKVKNLRVSELSVLSVPPGATYSVKNGSSKTIDIYYFYKYLNASSRILRGSSPRLGDKGCWSWACPNEETMSSIKQCFTWDDGTRGFFELEQKSCIPFSMLQSPMLFLVLNGEIELRSTKFEDFENSRGEMESCLTTETLKDGSFFFGEVGCCISIENHQNQSVYVFYDQVAD